jgi:hypothetical protein
MWQTLKRTWALPNPIGTTEIQITSLIGLKDVVRVQPAPAAAVVCGGWRWLPIRQSPLELVWLYQEFQPPAIEVKLDSVTITHRC